VVAVAGEGSVGSFGDGRAGTRSTSQEALVLALRLMTGEVRHVTVGTQTVSIGNALDRLADWIETDEGSWVHKRFVVEATVERVVARTESPERPGSHERG
jgi:hypothetical protein